MVLRFSHTNSYISIPNLALTYQHLIIATIPYLTFKVIPLTYIILLNAPYLFVPVVGSQLSVAPVSLSIAVPVVLLKFQVLPKRL